MFFSLSFLCLLLSLTSTIDAAFMTCRVLRHPETRKGFLILGDHHHKSGDRRGEEQLVSLFETMESIDENAIPFFIELAPDIQGRFLGKNIFWEIDQQAPSNVSVQRADVRNNDTLSLFYDLSDFYSKIRLFDGSYPFTRDAYEACLENIKNLSS